MTAVTDTPGTAINLELCQKFIILSISSLIYQSVSIIFVDPETACSLLKYSDYMFLRH